jgi:hypothetical protein
VVCSACGFENQGEMRYCGMCGTPLPHRPLTTPGAQSTLNFTRVPLESGSTWADQSRGASASSRTGVLEPSSGNGRTSTVGSAHVPGAAAPVESAPPVDEVPPTELVPDVSLDEYIQKFRYEPPSDDGEVTMRMDAAPMVEAELPGTSVEQASPAAEAPPLVDDSSAETDHPAEIKVNSDVMSSEAVAADSVASRLGLEPETAAEERIDRPRFLDVNAPEVNEPPKEIRPAASAGTSSGTSTIVGPSFLGLSDPPLAEVETSTAPYEGEEEQSASHWRGWMAFAILVIFAILGVMEWRSQGGSADHGILQVMSMKLRNWRHSSTPPADVAAPSSATPAPAAADANPKPDQTSQPAKPNAAQTSAPSPSSPQMQTASKQADLNARTASTPPSSPMQKSTPPKQSASLSPKPAVTSDTSALAPRPTGDQAATPKPQTLGAEEMAKAKNASDSAAAAAWLWKATAKGNPDAPVQLADMYIRGNGVPRSCEQAMVLLKTAAAKENATARNRLGSMYESGNCVQRNRVEAYRWMSAALQANPYSEWAQQSREQLWQQMTPEEQAAAQKYR